MKNPIQRIAKNGILLALMCVMGMFSIPFADNVKVSLQLYMVFVICLLCDAFYDAMIITGCYLLIGLFLPVYAGFASGISPTFGFVIGFVVASPVIYFMNRIPRIPRAVRMALACLAGTLIVYIAGTMFMMLYLNWDIGKTLMVSVVPYLGFDAVKIVLAILTVLAMPSFINHERKTPSDRPE